MMRGRTLAVVLVVSLLANAFCLPADWRQQRGYSDNELDSKNVGSKDPVKETHVPLDDDDDDFGETMPASSSNSGGSNIFSLLNMATALFPGSSSSNANVVIRNMIRQFLLRYQNNPLDIRRTDVADNEIEIDYISDLTPPFQKQESEENETGHESESIEDDDDDDDNAAEESVENGNGMDSNSKQDSASNASNNDDSDYDSDEPPEGDGQGGGILGLLAGLSGGEDGESDLGSLLAAVSGIVANLSGDGFDLNALLASAFGLFVGLLSEGEENPGAVIASYLLTSLDTITGGGSKNNGAFFGTFLSKLVKGTSAKEDSGSNEDDDNGTKMSDSAGFFTSLLLSLLGDMSKGSSGGSSQPWK